MKTPSSVPPRARRGGCAERVTRSDTGGRTSVGLRGRYICSGALMPSTASPFASTIADGDDEREAREPQSRVVDEEALGIIVTVEFAGQILEVVRDLVRRELARRARELAGKVGDPPQQRLLVRTRQRRQSRRSRARTPPRRASSPAAFSTDATRACAYCT